MRSPPAVPYGLAGMARFYGGGRRSPGAPPAPPPLAWPEYLVDTRRRTWNMSVARSGIWVPLQRVLGGSFTGARAAQAGKVGGATSRGGPRTSGEVEMAQWYYSKGGEQKGPVEQQELQRLLSTGEVKSSDLVWRDGLANWQAASQVPELAAVAGTAAAGVSAARRPAGRLSAAAARLSPTTSLRPAGAAAAGLRRVRAAGRGLCRRAELREERADGDDPLDHRPGLLRYLRHHRPGAGDEGQEEHAGQRQLRRPGHGHRRHRDGLDLDRLMVIAIIGQIALRTSH